MNIVIAPDSFKECLSATEVAFHMAKGVKRVFPQAQVQAIPLSDGGEGLLDAIMLSINGRMVTVEVLDPLLRKIKAQYGLIDKAQTAVIEMAKASGLELLSEKEKNPLITSTFGTGQLIKHALDQGCKKMIIGIGGSATNDGGVGMVSALGAKFLDKEGQILKAGGGSLNELYAIDLTDFDTRLNACEVVVACDVSNPLTGEHGASLIYGFQKGGDNETVTLLDRNLAHYANVLRATFDRDVEWLPGAGAAGGTGAALMAFMNATLKTGIELVLETLQVEEYIKEANLVITGEGKTDAQTLNGKTITGIAKMAKKHGVPVIVITGKIGEDIEGLYDLGITAVYSIINQPMALEVALREAPSLIEQCVRNIMHTIKHFKGA